MVAECDRRGRGCEPIQPLGVEHRGRVPYAAHREREHADDSSGHLEPPPVVAGLQPVRAQPGHI